MKDEDAEPSLHRDEVSRMRERSRYSISVSASFPKALSSYASYFNQDKGNLTILTGCHIGGAAVCRQ